MMSMISVLMFIIVLCRFMLRLELIMVCMMVVLVVMCDSILLVCVVLKNLGFWCSIWV